MGSALLACTTGAARAATVEKPADHPWLLKADRVFDARGEQTHAGWVVLVQGDKIVAVGPASQVSAPAGTQTIALPGTTLLPGLIDAHSHIFLHPYNETLWNDQVLKESLPYRTIEAVQHVHDTLMAGFTALRDLGTEGAGGDKQMRAGNQSLINRMLHIDVRVARAFGAQVAQGGKAGHQRVVHVLYRLNGAIG
jgi:imidazolonepropionase-like amidohydrolase